MWLCALLAVAAFHEAQPLYDFRQSNAIPSALANIELLIPLSIPTDQLTSDELATNSRDDRDAQHDDSDEEETFSSIPAYAFTIDKELNSRHTDKLPMDTSRSLYLTNVWSRNNMNREEESGEEEGLPSVATAGKVACHELARRQKGRARELMLYLCEELLGVLRASCGCCHQNHKHQRAAPWFGPLGGRRRAPRPHKNFVNV